LGRARGRGDSNYTLEELGLIDPHEGADPIVVGWVGALSVFVKAWKQPPGLNQRPHADALKGYFRARSNFSSHRTHLVVRDLEELSDLGPHQTARLAETSGERRRAAVPD
jgi:hypothetical protein